MTRIACIGEALVDLFAEPEVADVGASERFLRAAGGAVSNVAIGIARLGGDVAFIGAVGRDPFGRFLIRTLAHEGVIVDGVRVVDAQTAVMVVARGPAGARDFLPLGQPGAHTLLEPVDVQHECIRDAACVHAGGYLLSGEPSRAATFEALAEGTRRGLSSFDPNVRPLGFADHVAMRDDILAACARAHLVKASADDLVALGLEHRDPARLLRGETSAAVVTDGALGCRWALRDGSTGSAAAPKVRATDTTGAGDAFMAALLWRIVVHHRRRLDAGAMTDAAHHAVVAGALACTAEGATASLPTAHDLTAFVRRAEGEAP